MMAYRGIRGTCIASHTFLTPALNGREWLIPRPDRFTPGKEFEIWWAPGTVWTFRRTAASKIIIIIIITMFLHACGRENTTFLLQPEGGINSGSYLELVYSFRNSAEGRQY
jgi:hypothetical protein